MSLAVAAPTRRATRATLPARGRDGSPATRLATASFVQSEVFEFMRYGKAAPSLPFTGRVDRRSRDGWGLPSRRSTMADDWKKSLPFPAHWLSYLAFKLLVLGLAVLVGLHYWGVI